MKFVVGEKGRNPEKKLPRPRFVHHETHMEGPRRELGAPAVGGERLMFSIAKTNLYYCYNCLAELQSQDWEMVRS